MTTGTNNVLIGDGIMATSTTGAFNVAIGDLCCSSITSGFSNTALGRDTLQSLTTGTASGTAITTVSNNIAIANAGTNTAGRIDIGTSGTHTATFISGIRGATTGVADAVGVLIDSSGQLGTINSARRYKQDIHEMSEEKALKLLELEAVEFKYKTSPEFQQYGLIADDVELVMPDMVAYQDGQIQTVHYERLHAYYIKTIQMLWKEVAYLKAKDVRRESRRKKK